MNGVVLLGLMASLAASSEGCSCLLTHPQDLFCNAEIVMQAKVYSPQGRKNVEDNIDRENHLRYYTLKVHRIYKLKDNQFGIQKNATVLRAKTGLYDSICGVELENNVKYAISGKFDDAGDIDLNLCDSLTVPWPHVTKQMRKNFQFRFQRNCKCNVADHNKNPNTCQWKKSRQDSNCYSRFSACVEDINSTTGGCKWHRNKHLKKCRLESKKPFRLP